MGDTDVGCYVDPAVHDLDAISLVLRVLLGPTIAFHGYCKAFRGGRLPGLTGWFGSMVMRPPKVQAYLAVAAEIGGGALILLGLLNPLAAASLVGLMTVAWYTVHRGKGFLITKDGWEYNLVLAVAAVVLAMVGPGEWSLDHLLGIDLPVGIAGGLLALGVGVGGAALQLALCFRPAPKAVAS